MPELPEVETTRRGVAPHVVGQVVSRLVVRDRRLRWPVQQGLEDIVGGQAVLAVDRRAKYLLFRMERGSLMLHLGMSGSLRVLLEPAPPRLHDHLELILSSGASLRYTDPRRFGSLHWLPGESASHPLLCRLGPEPLAEQFQGDYLHSLGRGRRSSVKSFIMDASVVVGVGNIYACEALHVAGIHPARAAGRIGRERYQRLAVAIRAVLEQAIAAGGTTLRDFVGAGGQPGYFSQALRVYGRAGEPCLRCAAPVRVQRLAQRSTYYCAACQH
ncbi:MAG: bifunctional DNA-formamidopyrimidine glycosylase/DNA-(apurinic or apyrimidinic site) lyase [Ectothiorhodospiraceae bacterium]|nr:bifunctional DNA-formamidopyrimidine glycosylase/DNA-(apurinic or apyrimidinic site) lyase [Ectothiorhodospiraceae bacterium]